jgi:hypothetical protein
MSEIYVLCAYLIIGVFVTGFFVGVDRALKIRRHVAEYMCLPAFLLFWPVALLINWKYSEGVKP